MSIINIFTLPWLAENVNVRRGIKGQMISLKNYGTTIKINVKFDGVMNYMSRLVLA